MAGFADDTSPALLRVERPVAGRQATRINIHREAPGSGLRRERGAESYGERGEAAIKTDGEKARGKNFLTCKWLTVRKPDGSVRAR